MDNQYFYFDEDDCSFKPLEYSTLEKVVYNASIWLLCGLVLAGIGIISLSYLAGTPAEIALKAENRELLKNLDVTRDKIEELDNEISDLAQNDNEIYRTVLGIEPISYDERRAGAGGADVYAEFDNYSPKTAEILKWTATNLENLERRVSIQQLSFDEIKNYYNKNREKLKHVPATRPVHGVVLSGFGMRYHPVLNYNRMHEGLDFRARVGTPIYATGDGTIKKASWSGNYGRLIAIDHGFGFETRFAHLSSYAKGIRAGKKVNRGDLIGYTGNSGLTEGPHLHYEVLISGKNADPLNYVFLDITPEEYNMFKRIVSENNQSMD